MKKILIGMTDFVLAETKLWSGNENESYEIAKSCLKYAQFLKQPLELWMFVPCDENGNFLEEPIETIGGVELYSKRYQQAKEVCIFENNLLSLDVIKKVITKNKTVEFLINYHYEQTGSYLETNRELF